MAKPHQLLTGRLFGEVRALEHLGIVDGKHRYRVRCERCLREYETFAVILVVVKTCRGCATVARLTKHGKSHSVEYAAWANMRYRCLTPTCPRFADYGGRGITVDPRWLGASGFENFLADVGSRPEDRPYLDRIDNDGPYTPDNVRWVTKAMSNANRRFNRGLLDGGSP